MEDERIVEEGNENKDHSVKVIEPPELCYRVCSTPLQELRRTTVAELQVGEPAIGSYLWLRTLEPTITGAINFEFGPNLLVPVEDHDKTRTDFCLHAHVHLRSETEFPKLLPVNTVFVLKEPYLVACPEEQFAVVVGSPSDFVLVGDNRVLYKDAEAVGWPQKLEDLGLDLAITWKLIGDALFLKGEYDEAVEDFLFALNQGGDNLTNLIIHQSLARVLFELGYYERAIKHCHKVLENVPKNQKSLNCIGLAHYKLRQFIEAKNYFQKLRTVSPTDEKAAAELDRCKERLAEAEGNVDVHKLFRASQTDTTMPIDHGGYGRYISFRLGPDNEQGVYATQDLAAGTLIMVEKPIVVTFDPHSPSERGKVDFMRAAFKAIMKNPNSVGRRLYYLPGGGTLTEEKKRIFGDEANELEPIVDVPRMYRLMIQNIIITTNVLVKNPPHSYQV